MARIWCTNRYGIHPASTPLLDNHLKGVSEPPYDELNVGRKVGDDPASVSVNRARLAEALGLSEIHFMDQIHSAVMLRGGTSMEDVSCDGIYLTRSDANQKSALAVQVADCVPLILASENIIAAVHVGREGLVKGMTESALDVISTQTDQALTAFIGPSICGDCYPVASEQFEIAVTRYPASNRNGAQYKVDVAAGVISVLEQREISWEWFGGTRECVFEDREYFSYRRDALTGRQAMVVSW